MDDQTYYKLIKVKIKSSLNMVMNID